MSTRGAIHLNPIVSQWDTFEATFIYLRRADRNWPLHCTLRCADIGSWYCTLRCADRHWPLRWDMSETPETPSKDDGGRVSVKRIIFK